MINRASIRQTVFLYLGFFLILMALLAWQSVNNYKKTSLNFEAIGSADSRQENSAELRFDLIQLQNYVRIHRTTGEQGIAVRIDSLYQALQNDLDQLTASPNRTDQETELLQRMGSHVQTYYESFQLAAEETSVQLSLTHEVLLPEIAAQNEQLELVIEDARPLSDTLLNRLADLRAILRDTRLNISEFLLQPDFDLVSKINSDIDAAKNLLEEISVEPAIAGEVEILSESIDIMGQSFSQIVNSTRGYLMLANVTMAGNASEFLNLANELEAIARTQKEQLFEDSYSQARSLQNWALITSVILLVLIIFAIFGINSFLLKPMAQLTEVFKRLVRGERVENISGDDRRDELGALAKAAEVFRAKNRETEDLLSKTSALAEELGRNNLQLEQEIVERTKIEHRLQQQSDELERSNEDLAQFAHVASHDLQEPLRMVASYLQLISRRYRDQLDTDGVEFIDFAVDGARRMQSLIRSLLEYSRISTQGKQFEQVDCNQALELAKQNLKLVIEETEANISSDELPKLPGDIGQLTRLFQNLLSNSIRYRGDKKPVIHITCKDRKQDFLISVTDQGVGFNQEYADRIFVIFQRLHAREEYPDSTGIGLSVCKRIVERHKGRIWAKAEIDKGSTFFFTLPSGTRF